MSVDTLTKNKNAAVIKKFARKAGDTGSPEVQVALITARIHDLTGHFKTFSKDNHSRTGLLRMVGQRRRLLNYLRSTDHERYSKLISALELRK